MRSTPCAEPSSIFTSSIRCSVTLCCSAWRPASSRWRSVTSRKPDGAKAARARHFDWPGWLFIAGLLVCVQWLPPDTSLAEVRRNGMLRVCMPPTYPPLVTGEPQRPGLEVELLRQVADRLGVQLAVTSRS